MENIFTSFKPIYFVSKILGLFPMSFDGPDIQGRFKIRWTDVIASFLSISILASLVPLVFLNPDLSNSTVLLAQLWNIQVIVGTFFLSLAFIYQIMKCKSTVSFLHAVNKFDEKVKLF